MWTFPSKLLRHPSVTLQYYGNTVLLLSTLASKEGSYHIPYVIHEGGKRKEMRALHNWWRYKIDWFWCPSQPSSDTICSIHTCFCIAQHLLYGCLFRSSHAFILTSISALSVPHGTICSPLLLRIPHWAPQPMSFCRQHLLQRAQFCT